MVPRANLAVEPELADMLAAANAPVYFAAGDLAPLVSVTAMQQIDSSAHVFAGLGHNVHAGDPLALWNVAEPLLAQTVPA